jgi:hypothetical protein
MISNNVWQFFVFVNSASSLLKYHHQLFHRQNQSLLLKTHLQIQGTF